MEIFSNCLIDASVNTLFKMFSQSTNIFLFIGCLISKNKLFILTHGKLNLLA